MLARVRALLGRDPTQIEEELTIHLLRTGHLHTVEEVILGRRPFTCPIGALLVLLLQISLLLTVARVFGEIALRLNQPAVVGEILAGIVL